MTGLRYSKLVVAICGGVPLALLTWDAIGGRLGADPVNYAIRTTGLLSLIFLVASLAVTPLRRATGWNTLVTYRRSLGLYGFIYAVAHLCIYVGFDRALNVGSAVDEILSRRYLQIGFAGILLMVPLAITSTDAMIRRLGPRRWKLLHRLAYLATIAGVIHYILLVKSDLRQPVAFAVVLGALLLSRSVWHYVDLRRAAARAAIGPGGGPVRPQASARVTPTARTAAAAPSASRKFWTGDLVVAYTFDETPDVRTFRLVSADGDDLPFDYQPGQYLTLRLDVDGKRVNRSYTIASSPTRRGYCELTVKREAAGVSSGHLHRQVRRGDRLAVAAPAGRFVFTGSEADSVVLIAGGVGITPLMSILRSLTDRAWPGDIYFIFAVRDEADIIFRDELEQLRRRFPNLRLCITLSRAASDGGWTGERGRITADLLRRFVADLPRQLVYLCGPNEMMNAVRDTLVELGVSEANVRTEAFVSSGSKSGEPAEAGTAGALTVSEPATAVPAGGEIVVDAAVDTAGDRTVTFARSGRAGVIGGPTTVLEAAEAAGVPIPYECRAGVCGQCKTRLLDGTVALADAEALSKSERAAGWILACQARAGDHDFAVDA